MVDPSRAAARASARTRILDAAVKLIAREGINDVRIARIAMEAACPPRCCITTSPPATRCWPRRSSTPTSWPATSARRAPTSRCRAAERLRWMIDQCLPAEGSLHDDWMLWVELWLHAARRPDLRLTSARLYARMHEWFARGDRRAACGTGELTVADRERTINRLLGADRRLRHPRADRGPGDAARARPGRDLGRDRSRLRSAQRLQVALGDHQVEGVHVALLRRVAAGREASATPSRAA